MIWPQQPRRRAHHQWLLPLCLLLAFQQTIKRADAVQQANEQRGDQEPGSAIQSAPLMSMGSESSSALESSAALAGDDLIAAESSQSPDSAEHKSFTSAQVVRQDSNQQQLAASVAPVFVAPPPQQQQAQQPPQPVQQLQAPMQPQMMHPQHLAMQARMSGSHPAHQQKAFNPFMAAALAGNYGLAQQQIAAAAAAGMHGPQQHQQQQQQQHQQQQLHAHPQPHQHAQQMHAPPMHHQMAGPSHQLINQAAPAHPQHPRQQQQQQMGVAPEQAALAVQESSVRSNVVPAPAFNAMVEGNSIEVGEQPAGPQQQQQQQQQAASAQALTAASSLQHPVIAASSLQESAASAWPLQAPDIPKIVNLEVKCEKNLMKVSIEFDKVFNGVIFSKGHYSQGQCVHLGQNSGKQQAYFDISINSCGTQGNTQNGLYGMGGNTGSGTYFENTIVVQYDPNVQEVYDHARKLRCTWHDQYEKAVTFRPFPVDMLDIVRADFAGDNVGCWMQIQVGKGPWASEVAGIVKIGQTMTMVLAIKDEENKFDMLVRNCFAHDGKRGPIELVDKSGCITRPKLMSRFTKIKNFGSSATVLSYAHFQAFKFPDSMEVHFQCTIQICRHQCPEQCSAGPNGIGSNGPSESYSESTISGTFNIHGSQAAGAANSDSVHLRKYGSPASGPSGALNRERRDLGAQLTNPSASWLATNGSQPRASSQFAGDSKAASKSVGLNRVIQVVSSGDLAFAIQQQQQQQQQQANATLDSRLEDSTASQLTRLHLGNQICMSSYSFVLSLVVLALILLCSCLAAVGLYLRQRSYAKCSSKLLVPHSTCSSPVSSLGPASKQNVPTSLKQQQQQPHLYQLSPQAHQLHASQAFMFESAKLRK